MSLASLLTRTRLRALAGYGYDRGDRYWQQGRVLSCVQQGDGIAGVVAGKNDYTVRLFTHGSRLISQCSCPVGDDGAFCKHAVALALHYLEPPAAAATSGPVFESRKELEAWCIEHQVSHELEVSAEVLIEPIRARLSHPHPGIAYVLRSCALRDIGSLEGARRFVGVRELQRPTAEAVRKRLERAAADVRDALAEEARPRAAPQDEALVALWTRLGELRRRLRKGAAPRSRATRAAGTLDLERSTGALLWKEDLAVAFRRSAWTTSAIAARLAFTPEPSLSCTCAASSCTHALALVDSALDLLADPAQATLAHTIAEELLRPPWQRALAELESHDHKPAAATRIEVWWQIDRQFGATTLTPVVKRQLKKGGFSAGTRMSPEKLLDEHGAALGEQDTRIAEPLAGWTGSRASTYPARAFAALVGHPRVVDGEAGDTPVIVRRVALGFTASPAGDAI